jgi:hypothetical protein
MRDPVEVWCRLSSLHLRDSLERKLWGDVFGAFDTSQRRATGDTPEQAADEAVVRMRIRQRTIEKVGRNEGGPFGFRVCAVCEGRLSHEEYCPNDGMPLPFSFAIPVVE